MENQTAIKIELNEQILTSKNEGLFVGRITEIREKAIKCDYAWESIWSKGNIVVFTYSCWIPKSVIITDNHGTLALKKWFMASFKGGVNIKKYFIAENNKLVFI